LIFITGGLGPTHDDVTKEAVARTIRRDLVADQGLLGRLRERFATYAATRPDVIENLAMVPQGSKIMHNPVGAAAGLRVDLEGTRIYVLPGVPCEMEAIFEDTIVAEVSGLSGGDFKKVRLVRTIGIRESEIAESLRDVMPGLGIELGFLPTATGVDLRLTASAHDEAAADKALDQATSAILPLVGRHVFSTRGEPLHVVVGNMLIGKAKKIAIAESCTGGLVGHLLTEVAGISQSLERGIIAYSNRAKVESLAVDEALIAEHGAVSSEVAQAMACGVRRLAQTDLGLATTGIAGPGGGTKEKPVGLVYTALADKRRCTVTENVFRGAREIVKQRAAVHALDVVRCYLLETEE
jgi:nicotinamide-nucleotide amidase